MRSALSGSCDGTPTFTKNDVYGNAGYEYSWTPYPVGDLTPVDPKIPNIDWGDWHISGTSPCRDQGSTPAVWMETDIDGESRVYNSVIDIGADEWNDTDPSPVNPTVIRVKPDGNDGSGYDGSNWDLAVATIQRGIDLAAGGGEVWVAAGEYAGQNGWARLTSFVKLYGGFTVLDTSKSARNWKANPTILDAASAGSVVMIGSALGCRVDGFTIRNGGSSGINCDNAIATIANNIIRDNPVSGLFAQKSALVVMGNVITGNFAYNFVDSKGAGIRYENTGGQIVNNTILWNIAEEAGGVYLASSSPAFSNNIVTSNGGGGIFSDPETCSPTFANNDVYGNPVYEYSWTTAYPVGNDLEPVDPGILNIDWGDWHISQGSPCCDQGITPAVWIETDIDGESRVYNSVIDIGADEWNDTDPSPVNPTVIRVKPDGNDDYDGSNWDLAVATIQRGIDLAYVADDGEVWVATGDYVGDDGRANLKSFVKLYGGFAVGDTSRSDQDPVANPTTLDGDYAGSVVTIDSAFGCQVDGFTIQHGAGKDGYYGGGIHLIYALATIANNTIANNAVGAGGYFDGFGAGIYCAHSSPQIIQNIIQSNTVMIGEGGGLFCKFFSCPLVMVTCPRS